MPALAVNIDTGKPELGGVRGGISGPAIKPIALHCVYNAVKNTKLPIIGMGGIMTGKDALEFFLVGAVMIEIGTGVLISPDRGDKILKEIERYLDREGIKKITEFKSRAQF